MRDFGPVLEDHERRGRSYKLTLSPDDAPVPSLLKYALILIGLEAYGPGEKVAWWVNFSYRGEWCELAHQKFGLRLYLHTDRPEKEARESQVQIVKQLRSAIRTVEKLILNAAPELLGKGNATVVNQHRSLRRAYEYFRERAVNPISIEDEHITYEPQEGALIQRAYSFSSWSRPSRRTSVCLSTSSCWHRRSLTSIRLRTTSRQSSALDGVRSSTACSAWEATLPVTGRDSLELWSVGAIPTRTEASRKGHGATIYLHTPGVNAAVPVGLTRVRDSPLFSFVPATETHIAEVFELFDEIDAWKERELSEAMRWIESGLDVRFDAAFRSLLAQAREEDDFAGLLEYFEYQQATIDNMDY